MRSASAELVVAAGEVVEGERERESKSVSVGAKVSLEGDGKGRTDGGGCRPRGQA